MTHSEKQRGFYEFIAFLITIICFFLIYWAIEIFQNTFIDWKILVPPIILGTVIFTTVCWRMLTKTGYSLWAKVFIGCVCGSGISHFGFLYLNQKFEQTEIHTQTFTITKKGTLAKGKNGCNQPYIVINFDGLDKEIPFYCQMYDQVQKSSTVKISYTMGLFGYNVIKEKSLQE